MLLYRAISPLILLALSVGAVSEDEVYAQLVPASKGKTTIAHPSSRQFLTAARSLTNTVPASTAHHRSVRRRLEDRQLKSDKKSKGPKSSKAGKAPKGPIKPVNIKKKLKKLKDKCYDRTDEICVFFSNFINPNESSCTCRPDAFTEDELYPVGVKSISQCKKHVTAASTWFTIGGALLSIGIAYVTAGASLVANVAAAWALLGAVPGLAQEGLNRYVCGEDGEKVELILDFKQTVAYIGQPYNENSYKDARRRVDALETQLNSYTEQNVTISLNQLTNIVAKIENIQDIGAQGEISGAKLVAHMGILHSTYITQQMVLEDREHCKVSLGHYKNSLENTIGLIDNTRGEFEARFEHAVKCKPKCPSGGCFCIFCGDKNVHGKCSSSIANLPAYQKSTPSQCGGCDSIGPGKADDARKEAQGSWTAAVNEWWTTDMQENYDQLKELLKNADSLSGLCERCGPKANENEQSCQCGVLPYCNAEIGACDIKASDNQIDREYDAPNCDATGERFLLEL